jgi:hypothetical protein
MRALALLLTLLAVSAFGAGILVDTGVRYEFTDCSSSGSSSLSPTEGTYLMRVTDSDVFLCWASSCASGGEKFPSGTVLLLAIPRGGQALSCRSSGSAGDVILTKAGSP